MSYRIGIDVGGTFTDFVLVRPSGELVLHKEATTPGDESEGVMRGIRALAAGEKLEARELLAKTDLVAHGTTTADNTMIQMSGAVTGLLTTEGHRDQIEIRRGYKEQIWDPAYPPPVPIAPRRRRIGIPERLDFRGQVVRPLDEQATRRGIQRLKKQGVESIAVCFLFSYLNPAHELRARELCREEHPAARVSLSHEIMPTAPEFERVSTTLVDAYVRPRVEAYLGRLQRALSEAGYPHDLVIVQSSGGVMTADFVKARPVATLGSGPAGGITASCHVAASAGIDDFIAVDMGGTSYEACLVKGGKPSARGSWNWVQRYLVGLPMLDIHAIGAGGGSIASVEGGALKVGPRSAGAEPGPICYGRGGTEPTVTDANVALGRLNPRALCGGAFELDTRGVREAIAEKIGRPLGLDAEHAALGILRIVDANMANAIRRVSAEVGHDPRTFSLLVYGGNGPVHAAKQAEELGIRRIVIPRTSPAFSALGLLVADLVVEGHRAYVAPAGRVDPDRLGALFAELEREAAAAFERVGGGRSDVRSERTVAMSYPGQTFEMSVAVPDSVGGHITRADVERIVAALHDLHESQHGFAARDEEPVVRGVGLTTTLPADKLSLSHYRRSGEASEASDGRGGTERPFAAKAAPGPHAAAARSADDALTGRRPVFFDKAFVETPVYDGERLGPGHSISGPAIVEERFTTVVLHPGHELNVDPLGNFQVTL
jgi:N-methylhydantoinase A